MRWVISFSIFFNSSIMNGSLTKMLNLMDHPGKISREVNSNFESDTAGPEEVRFGCFVARPGKIPQP